MAVKIKIMTIPGAPLKGLNPLPMFHNKNFMPYKTAEEFPDELKKDLGARTLKLPYKMQDRYSRKRQLLKMKTIVMENEYLKATFWPENGGRLYSLYDKVLGRELLMKNPVYQPGNLAIRNAWISGGIEWNFGCLGHNCFTVDNLFAAVLKDEQGNEFVRVYEFERSKNTIFQIDFHLPDGSPILYSHVKIFNPFDEDTTTYWWTNIAFPEDGHTRVFSSVDMAIVYTDNEMTYEKLPYLSAFAGKDLSYPNNAARGFDYFFQAPAGTRSTWEAGALSDGLVFFDRSTAPLSYHKVFSWGNHSAGKHWQEFLADPGQGYYIELQAGFARSQLHDKMFPANSSIEWTQCFGGAMLDKKNLHQEEWAEANIYLKRYIDSVISEEALYEYNKIFSKIAKMEVTETDLIHYGSGWGALEAHRMAYQNDGTFPKSVCFPKATIGEEQYPWYALLTEGKMPEEAPEAIPPSWMVSKKWMVLLEESLKNGGESWYSMMHFGVMLNEMLDSEHVVSIAGNWSEYPTYRELAKKAFERSVELRPSVWALRGLFCIAQEENNDELAEMYYDQIFEMDDAVVDFAFAVEFIQFLNKKHKYEKAWKLYESLPEKMKSVERLILCALQAAIKLKKLDFIAAALKCEFADIKEGETSLTDIWFEYCALKMALERGLGDDLTEEQMNELIDEAWDHCPPPAEIDFRMSFDRKKKYRMED